MNLLILPGAGNPDFSPLYAEVYRTLSEEARRYGFTAVYDTVRWAGQAANPDQAAGATLSLAGAVEIALVAARAMPKGPYAILGRSFGCTVALKVVARLTVDEHLPERLIFWGPPPFWSLWEMFVRDFSSNREKAAQKGVFIGAGYFHGLEPVESLLRKAQVPTAVTSGTEDGFCPPPFNEYLRSLCSENARVDVKPPIKGAGHEVTAADGADIVALYGAALFD
jgi:pimeloyl-ACP methyl ester carboxylesterase